MEEEVLKRIRNIRLNKGYSYENLANDLNISTSAYRKIELNIIKLTLERLYQISEILEVKIGILLGIITKKHNEQDVLEDDFVYQEIKHLHTENEKFCEKLIQQFEKRLEEKEEIIKWLKNNFKI